MKPYFINNNLVHNLKYLNFLVSRKLTAGEPETKMPFIIYGEHGKTPKNAKELTAIQVSEFYDRVIKTWTPQSQIWALSKGPAVLGVVSAISGIYINSIFRRKLRLGVYGQFATYLPIAVLPTLMTVGLHKMIIQADIIMKPNECSLCTQTNATLLQMGVGIVQPFVLASASTLMFATRHFTYRFPSITSEPLKFFKFYRSLIRTMGFPTTINIVLQVIIVQYITYKEREQFFIMQNEISKDIPHDDDEITEVLE